MKRYQLFLAISAAAFAGVGGCGDNSKVCGPGTDDNNGDGTCEPTGGSASCSDGTILDPNTNACVIDPNSCQNGTVLINNRCVDPTEGLVVDLMEGAEPNNLGAGGIEASGDPAGVIQLKAQGSPFVVKGTINPHRDDDGNGEIDPDMDVYLLSVTAPVVVEVSVDGVNGLMGAFLALPASGPAAGWIRYGMNITGDTSKRQLYLPAAGQYAISVGDTRSLFLDGDSPPAAGLGGAAGAPNANYYMSLTVVPTPAPTALTVTGGTATNVGTLGVGEVKTFTVQMGTGVNDVALDMPTTPNASVILAKNNEFKGLGDETFDFFEGPLPATVNALGFKATDTALIVADATYNYGPEGAPFTLTVNTGEAGELSTTGGSVSQPEDTVDFSAFFYDVATADEVTGFALTFDQPVAGVVVDENFFLVANFTYDPAAGFTNRFFSGYTGLIRHAAPGRYYFLTFDPVGAGATSITATSTYAAQTVGTVAVGTPLLNQTVNATFQSNAFNYNAGATDAWQLFNATGTGTGNITNVFFKPAEAYGRLDTLTTTGTGTIVADVLPVFSQTYAATGAAQGRVLLDDGTTQYFVTTNTATVTGAPTFNLDFKSRGHFDYGDVAAGMTVVRNGETLDATNAQRFYLLRTTPGYKVEIKTDPVTATLDSVIRTLNRDETVRRTVNNGVAGLDDVIQLLQTGDGWTAFTIASPTAVGGTLSYNLTVSANIFTPPVYTRATSTTVFDNACVGGGVTVPLIVDGSNNGPANDEGFSATPIAAPANFNFFGFIEPVFTISANGWLSFGAVTTALFTNLDMPLAAVPNGVIAPYWDDLENVVVCTKTVGTKLIVQWTGNRFTAPTQTVQTQAILDATGNTIEFVWGPNHVVTGAFGTVGIEDQVGGSANKIGFNLAGSTPLNTAQKFTPN